MSSTTPSETEAQLAAENANLKTQNAALVERIEKAERKVATMRKAVNLAFQRVNSVKTLHQNAADEAAVNAQKATERIQQALGDAHQALGSLS